VIPVLDLRAGRAVLARGGRRDTYAPVRSLLVAGGAGGGGDPLALARAYRDILDCDEWYVADLDALAGGPVQRALLGALAGLRGRLLVDAAVATPERARELVADGAARVAVGLETLPSFDALAAVARAIGPKRVVFSLDLRDGAPLAEAAVSGTPLAPGPSSCWISRGWAADAAWTPCWWRRCGAPTPTWTSSPAAGSRRRASSNASPTLGSTEPW